MNEIMDGAATPVQIAGLRRSRCGSRARRSARSPGWPEAMLEHATPDLGARPGRGPGRHRRRRRAHRQHLDHGHDHRGRGRGPDGQARQPGGVLGVRRRPTCWRRSASSSTCRRPRPSNWWPRSGAAFLFASLYHPAFRYAVGAAARAGRADGLQLSRPADQPGPAGRAGRGRGGPADGAAPGRRAGRARQLGPGLPRRRRAGRADHDRAVDRLGGLRRHRAARSRSTRPTWASPGPSLADLAGGDAAHNAGGGPRLPGRRARARSGTSCC